MESKKIEPLTIDDKMRLVNQKIESFLLTNDSFMNEVMEWQLRSRGKQLRPKLLLLAAAFGKWKDSIAEVAAALEILHMASLVHDDIVDDAQQRRGNDSVQFRFGRNVAVYAGDYMVFCVLSKLSYLPSKQQCDMYRSLSNLCKGELMQYENLHNLQLTEDQYFQQIQGKTATLFQVACSAGAIEGGCKEPVVEALAEFGRHFGIMFQLQDDLLDCIGAQMGKPTKTDVGLGVYTLPIIYALNNSSQGMRLKELLEEYRNTRRDDIYVEIQDVIVEAGGVQYAVECMRALREGAIKAIDVLPNNKKKENLMAFFDSIYNKTLQVVDNSVASI